jgi:diguanylate cyclase (GGDEF)-like protein
MAKPDIPANEKERLEELRTLGILDSAGEERFDRITRLAQRLFGVSTVLVSLVDQDRQWFKSRVGLDATETSRDVSFCGHAILSDDVLMVPDATKDGRFLDNPLVVGSPDIRFYAGCPIAGPGGAKLGTLCLIDQLPRELSAEEIQTLRDLADMVENEIATSNLAVTDSLTGLGNRRGFDMAAPLVLEINRRKSIDSALLYLDLDKFKAINDGFGHAEGDRALQEFASLLRSALRVSDVIARVGGDEFVVLLSGTSEYEGALQRLRGSLVTRNEVGTHRYRLETSVGIAILRREEHETLDLLLHRADEAMYLEKLSKH